MQDSALVLTGPSRAVLAEDIMNFEVELRVKGSRESEDKILSFLVIEQNCILATSSYGKLYRETHTNKYCTTELLFSQLRDAVEATVDVKVVEGSWSQDFCLRFIARTKKTRPGGERPPHRYYLREDSASPTEKIPEPWPRPDTGRRNPWGLPAWAM